jgi:hypothetical protein
MATASGLTLTNPAATIGGWKRVIMRCNIPFSPTLRLFELKIGSGTIGQVLTANYISNTLSLFDVPVGGAAADVSIAELIVTSGQPTAAEIAALDDYGVARYGGGPFA